MKENALIKAHDWWSAVLGEKEEFDQGCLCLADVDNTGTGQGGNHPLLVPYDYTYSQRESQGLGKSIGHAQVLKINGCAVSRGFKALELDTPSIEK